jgi:hypothetical protein
MSNMRPEACPASRSHLGIIINRGDRKLLLEYVLKAINKRRSLIRGKLEAGGKCCAMGALWKDQPTIAISNALIDEVAAVNDAKGDRETPKARWKRVQKWLRKELAALE